MRNFDDFIVAFKTISFLDLRIIDESVYRNLLHVIPSPRYFQPLNSVSISFLFLLFFLLSRAVLSYD